MPGETGKSETPPVVGLCADGINNMSKQKSTEVQTAKVRTPKFFGRAGQAIAALLTKGSVQTWIIRESVMPDFIHVKFVAGDGQEVDSFLIDVGMVLDPEPQHNIRFPDVLGYEYTNPAGFRRPTSAY
jgi:hypothetical protein